MSVVLNIGKRLLREQRGQSMTEFALTLPMMFMFAFIVMQTAIVLSIAHQGSYASFAAARFERVACVNGNCKSGTQLSQANSQAVVDAILDPSSRYYGMLQPRWNSEGDGGVLRFNWQQMNTALPYSAGLAGCTSHSPQPARGWSELRQNNCSSYVNWEIPTHLGRNVYQDPVNMPPYNARKSPSKYMLTDNNIDDDK